MKFSSRACGTNMPIQIRFESTASASTVFRVTAEQLAKAWGKPVEQVKQRLDQIELLQQQGRMTDNKWERFFDWMMRDGVAHG